MQGRTYSPKVCVGQYSIQRDINRIAFDQGKIWKQLVRDKEWREKTRQELRAMHTEWCDYQAGTCYCDVDAGSTPPSDLVNQVNELFPQ